MPRLTRDRTPPPPVQEEEQQQQAEEERGDADRQSRFDRSFEFEPYALTTEEIKTIFPENVPGYGSRSAKYMDNLINLLARSKELVSEKQLSVPEYQEIITRVAPSLLEGNRNIVSGRSDNSEVESAQRTMDRFFSEFATQDNNGNITPRAPTFPQQHPTLEPSQPTERSTEEPYLIPPELNLDEDTAVVTNPQTGERTTVPVDQVDQQPLQVVIDPATGDPIQIPLTKDVLADTVPKNPDQRIIEDEAKRQEEQQRQAFEAEKAIRAQRLKDLATFLSGEEERKFGLSTPGIAEAANAAGLYRSTGYGEALARERARLAGETNARLTEQGLTDRDAEILGISNILAQRQGFQTQGLERRFSLEDFARQVEMAKKLGTGAAPTVPRSSGKGGGGVVTGALGGAQIGAAAGGHPLLGGALGGIAGAVSSLFD